MYATSDELRLVLAEAAMALSSDAIPFVVGGGLAAEFYNLRESHNDVDLFVRPVDAPRAFTTFERARYRCWIEDPRWLYKALAHGVTVDIIYESSGLVHVGDETFRRARLVCIGRTSVPIMPPEDLFVMKAAAATPAAPKHWIDALSLLSSQPMDWEYLASISTGNSRKTLGAIVSAYDQGVPVPSFVFVRLAQALIK
jgi:hypothetical protein